jgi:hypothetical protein
MHASAPVGSFGIGRNQLGHRGHSQNHETVAPPVRSLLTQKSQRVSGKSSLVVMRSEARITNGRLKLENFRCKFLHNVGFDNIALLDITEIFQADTTFESGSHFGGIVLKSTQ